MTELIVECCGEPESQCQCDKLEVSQELLKDRPDREKIAKATCEALNCDISMKANCRVNFNVICEGCYKVADQILDLFGNEKR